MFAVVYRIDIVLIFAIKIRKQSIFNLFLNHLFNIQDYHEDIRMLGMTLLGKKVEKKTH